MLRTEPVLQLELGEHLTQGTTLTSSKISTDTCCQAEHLRKLVALGLVASSSHSICSHHNSAGLKAGLMLHLLAMHSAKVHTSAHLPGKIVSLQEMKMDLACLHCN